MTEIEYNVLNCKTCNQNIIVECIILRGFGCFESVYCPTCSNQICEVRCDEGFPKIINIE